MSYLDYSKKNNSEIKSFTCEEQRKSEIEFIKNQHPHIDKSFFDKNFTFYYDETNNFRKIYLDENKGFNIRRDLINSNFCLGGLVLEGENRPDIDCLKNKLQLQKTVKEIKLKHIAEGGFLNILSSPKLSIFLYWLIDNNIYVHFSVTNILYWSIVDIIDSLIDFDKWSVQMKIFYYISPFTLRHMLSIDEYTYQTYLLLKDELYQAVVNNIKDINVLLLKYKYPNINKNEIKNFIKDLRNNLNLESSNDLEYPHLKTFFEMFGNSENAPFITDEKDYMLLENFSSFYLRNLCLFNKSRHILDIEKNIIEELEQRFNINPPEQINYQFVDSKEDSFIQLSDVFIGIMGKMADFIGNISSEELKKITLNDIQIKNLGKLSEILNRSIQKCPTFSHSIVPIKFIYNVSHFYSMFMDKNNN